METKNDKYLKPNFESIPDELKALNQWICWREEIRDGKPTKVPYKPRNGKKAKVNDSATWTGFEKACQEYEKGNYSGIGFVLTKNDPLVGWDLDDCRNPETGEIEPWAQEIIDRLNSYTEISPSGTGIRIFIKGILPEGARRNGKIEVYNDARYLTVTGHHIEGTPSTFKERNDELQSLYAAKIKKEAFSVEPGKSSGLEVDDLLEKAFGSKSGDEIKSLFEGDLHGYSSPSEADFHLCGHLAFWLDCDPSAIDSAFRKSKLIRPKWDERRGKLTYGQRTINQAIKAVNLTYQDGLAAKEAPFIKAIQNRLCRVANKFKNIQYTPISSFIIKPLDAIEVEDEGEYLRVKMKNGDVHRVLNIPPDSWQSLQKFLKILPTKEFTFTGNSVDVQLMRKYVSTLEFSRKEGVRTAGFHDGHFVTEDGAISKNGISEKIIYISEIKSHCKIIKEEKFQAQDISGIEGFNTPKVVMPVLGFAAATFFKPQIMESFKKFPILTIEGEAGAGKTSTVTEVLMRMWAMESEPHSIGEQTRFSLMKLVSASNAIPVIFEENKSGAQNSITKSLISNLIRSTYNNLEGQRGKADQSLVTYNYQAPVVIAGETGFAEPAILDRTIPVSMSKMDSAPYLDKFLALGDIPFEKIGRSLLQLSLESTAGKVKKTIDGEFEKVSGSLNDRPRFNAAIARFGLKMLSEVTGVEFDPEYVDRAIIDNIYGDGRLRKSAVDKILEAMSLMSEMRTTTEKGQSEYIHLNHLEQFIHYEIKGNQIRLHVHGIYPVFKRWAKEHDFDGDLLLEDTFKKQLKKETYFVANKNVRIGGKQKNAYVLDLNKMKTKGLEIGEELKETF